MLKHLSAEAFTLTEIGGVGEMIYRAARFPEYIYKTYPEVDEDLIEPLYILSQPPEAGSDASITGQDLLASLCNLYKKVNAPDYSANITELVWGWCRSNIYPYQIGELCADVENGEFRNVAWWDHLHHKYSFKVQQFVSDLCNLGVVFEYYDALQKVKYEHNTAAGRNLYYEGRFGDSLPFLERYWSIQEDAEYVRSVSEDYDELIFHLTDLFPDFRLRLKQDQKTHKVELVADIDSVFDISWYTFARLVATVAPPVDTDLRYEYSQGSILTCMSCGEYFVRHSSRQRYCDNPNCQAERNKRKSRAYYQRKKAKG